MRGAWVPVRRWAAQGLRLSALLAEVSGQRGQEQGHRGESLAGTAERPWAPFPHPAGRSSPASHTGPLCGVGHVPTSQSCPSGSISLRAILVSKGGSSGLLLRPGQCPHLTLRAAGEAGLLRGLFCGWLPPLRVSPRLRHSRH